MKIALLGDIAFFGKYSLENKNVFNYFKNLSELLKGFDVVIGNLETPLIDEAKPFGAKSAHIKAKEKNVELLKYLNINYVNLANNHIYDFGLAGYERTKRILSDNNIEFFGIENKEVYIDYENTKLALSGYCCYSTNALGYQQNLGEDGINELNGFFLEKSLKKNHKKGYLNIVSIHAGQEHVNYPNTDHMKLARALARKVPYIYYGHHPHVMQGLEEVGKSLIAYSLGNLCFDDVYTNKAKEPLIKQSKDNKKSFILSIEIECNEIKEYKVVPFYLGESQAELFVDEIKEEIKNISKELTFDYETIYNKRKHIITKYVNNRKKMRNLAWYIKRMNLNSLYMILNSKKNSMRYNKLIHQYVAENSKKVK